MRIATIVPAYQAEASVADVVRGLGQAFEALGSRYLGTIVVDDGSSDETSERAREAGAKVVRHARNQGKGMALLSGMREAWTLGAEAVVSVDADGQHPPEQALLLARSSAPREALLLGTRNMKRAGAPKAARFSNRFSNVFLSWFSGKKLGDTQCGLRRYPLPETLAIEARSSGYEFESEIILRAAQLDWPILELPVEVYYPPQALRVSHFRVARDPARIVARVLVTVVTRPKVKSDASTLARAEQDASHRGHVQ